jgi:actin-related protein
MYSPLTTILDIGLHTTKCGFGGSKKPHFQFPSIISFEPSEGKYLFGNDCKKKIENDSFGIMDGLGEINEEYFELLLNHLFNEKLNTYPSEIGQSVLLALSPFTTEKQRKFIFELMFETFSTNLFKVEYQPVLSLFESGKTSGVVLECGESCTYACGILDGKLIEDSFQSLSYGGLLCSVYFNSLLNHMPYFQDKFRVTMDDLHFLKAKHCFVPLDFGLENDKNGRIDIHEECVLPDGQKFVLTYEKYNVGESFFQPIISDNVSFSEEDGIQNTLLNCVKSLDSIESLKKSIILSGGSMNFKGMKERIELEISTQMNQEIETYMSKEPGLSTWIGGSIFSSMSCFQDLCVKIQDYEEKGFKSIF